MSRTEELEQEVRCLRRELAACLRAQREADGRRITHVQEALGAAVSVLPDAVFLHDAEGKVLHANQAYLELVGRERGRVIGKPYWELFPQGPGPTPGCVRALTEPGFEEEEFPAPGGRVVRMRSFAVCDEVAYHCSLHVLEDITERRHYEDSLLRANEELERFAFVASHDLKAPLRGVYSLSIVIEEEVAGLLSAEGRERLNLLRERIHLMDALINGMLDYSRAGAHAACIEEVSTKELVAEVVAVHGAPEGFSVTAAPDLPDLVTDHLHLQQVFANLIGNAIEHHDRRDGHVEVSARDAGEFYEFTVSDDGPGIPSEYQKRIFEMFQRGAAKKPGTGIGLAVVRRVVERVGGAVRLESSPGRGSVFRFTWPKVMHEMGKGRGQK